ncbi:MATE family efflux transporter, partial [bacterium]|nr:MATE family efflux transporter [bacterium]
INSFIMFFLNKSLVIYGGDMAISAMGIVMSIQTIMIMPIVGLSQGAQPIIGYNFGAGIFSRVEETVKRAVVAGTIFVLCVFLLMRSFPTQIMMMFTQNPELQELGTKCMNTWFLALPLIAIQILGSCYFQSIGKVLPSLFLTSTRQLIFLIPAIYFLPKFWNFDGLLYSAPLSDFLSAVLTAIFLFKDINKEKKRRLELETA